MPQDKIWPTMLVNYDKHTYTGCAKYGHLPTVKKKNLNHAKSIMVSTYRRIKKKLKFMFFLQWVFRYHGHTNQLS